MYNVRVKFLANVVQIRVYSDFVYGGKKVSKRKKQKIHLRANWKTCVLLRNWKKHRREVQVFPVLGQLIKFMI